MDNFKQIRSLLEFNTLGDFYFIQLFKRRKDNPELSKSEKLIDSFYIFSLEEYDNVEPKIKLKCMDNNARAYIRLNRRNSNDLATKMIKELAECIISKQTNHLPKLFNSCCGKYHSEREKKWLVDIDTKDVNIALEVKAFIRSIADIECGMKQTIPTINGYHLIVSPFNRKLFSEKYPDIDVQLDNPTLLFYETKRIKETREEIV